MVREFTCIICPNGCEITAELEKTEDGACRNVATERGVNYESYKKGMLAVIAHLKEAFPDIKDRFKMIMDREKLTAGAFAESIGVAQATISHILGPRNKYPSTEVILRLHQRYNDINLEWLVFSKPCFQTQELKPL